MARERGIVGIPSIRLKEIAKLGSAGVLTSCLATNPTRRADFHVRIAYLASVPRVQWHKKQFRSLKKGISEIKWSSDKQEWRALGFDSGGFFIVVRCCNHKQRVYDPPDCIDRAAKLKKETEAGMWEIRSYEF